MNWDMTGDGDFDGYGDDFPDSATGDESSGEGSSSGGGVLRKGPWSDDEDAKLKAYIEEHGEGNWKAVQRFSGLLRCSKSIRLRWMNHLRTDLKKGPITPEEERLIVQLHAQLGNKWSLIAARLPGRTDNEVKNFWNTRAKRLQRAGMPLYHPDVVVEIQPEGQQRQESTTLHNNNLPGSHSFMDGRYGEIEEFKIEGPLKSLYMSLPLLDIPPGNMLPLPNPSPLDGLSNMFPTTPPQGLVPSCSSSCISPTIRPQGLDPLCNSSYIPPVPRPQGVDTSQRFNFMRPTVGRSERPRESGLMIPNGLRDTASRYFTSQNNINPNALVQQQPRPFALPPFSDFYSGNDDPALCIGPGTNTVMNGYNRLTSVPSFGSTMPELTSIQNSVSDFSSLGDHPSHDPFFMPPQAGLSQLQSTSGHVESLEKASNDEIHKEIDPVENICDDFFNFPDYEFDAYVQHTASAGPSDPNTSLHEYTTDAPRPTEDTLVPEVSISDAYLNLSPTDSYIDGDYLHQPDTSNTKAQKDENKPKLDEEKP